MEGSVGQHCDVAPFVLFGSDILTLLFLCDKICNIGYFYNIDTGET